MKLFDQINEKIAKGFFALNPEDEWDMITIQDQLNMEKATRTKTIFDLDQQKGNIKSVRTLELKEEVDENGKKKYTEVQITSIIQQELEEITTKMNVAKFEKEMIEGRCEALANYIIAIRNKNKVIYNSEGAN